MFKWLSLRPCPSAEVTQRLSYEARSITESDAQILQGSDDGVRRSGLLGFWTLSIVPYSQKH
jgi:hypothetical protein